VRRPLELDLLVLLCCSMAACTVRDSESTGSGDTASARTSAVVVRAAGDSLQSNAGEVKSAAPRSSGTVEYYTAAMLAHIGDSLARGSSTGHMLRGNPTYQYLQIRRSRNGEPEIHDRWTDVTMVQAGRATLVSGGRVSGDRDEGGGEHRGGTITGGSSRPVGSGDLMVIPAGTPHQYLVAPGDSLRYLTVKVLAGDHRPIS
jgi:hypothetical protein